MSMTDVSIADYCVGCGGGFRVFKPGLRPRGSAEVTAGSIRMQARPEMPLAVQQPQTDHISRQARFQYKVVPFIGRAQGSLSASDVASQLESVIMQHASGGWEFYQLSDVNIEVNPGCIAGLFGATTQYVRFDQLIFRSTTERS